MEEFRNTRCSITVVKRIIARPCSASQNTRGQAENADMFGAIQYEAVLPSGYKSMNRCITQGSAHRDTPVAAGRPCISATC